MLIEVKQRNIDKGVPRHMKYCAIARALWETLGFFVLVEENGRVLDFETKSTIGYLPKEAIDRFIRYDRSSWMKPFNFEMEITMPEKAEEATA